MDDELNAIPVELLNEVLGDAMMNSGAVQSEFSCSAEDDRMYAEQQDKISLAIEWLRAATNPRTPS